MKFIIGQKLGMTRVFDQEGKHVAATLVKALPAEINQIRTTDKDGYNAVSVKAFSKADKKNIRKIAEFKINPDTEYKIGQSVVAEFAEGDSVTVEGSSKGKGFAGTIKRHGFAMGPVTHGSKNVRKPGSIGGGYPERVVPGRRMAGRMGGKHVTVTNLKVLAVNDEVILISGAIPGPNKSILKVYSRD